MGLTVEQAVEAGKLAARIIGLREDIEKIERAIEGGAVLVQIVAASDMGTFKSDFAMDASETKDALAVMRGIIQSNADRLIAELGALGE